MRSLVTGGAGFIGSHLVRGLLHAGHEVRVIDDFRTGQRANLTEIADAIELIEGSICDASLLRRALTGVDNLFHLAAMPSVRRSVASPQEAFEVNIAGTHTVLLAARDQEVPVVVMASSSSVYGDTPELPKAEHMVPRPLCPYAAHKLALEGLGHAFSASYGMNIVCLRYFNVFGPRQNPFSDYAAVIPAFIRQLLAGERPVIFGDGEQTRDFTYVENVVAANLRAAEEYREREAGANLVANIAMGERRSVNELHEALARACGVSIAPIHDAPRIGEVRDSVAAVEVARAQLGYVPAISFEEGLRRTVAWYQARL